MVVEQFMAQFTREMPSNMPLLPTKPGLSSGTPTPKRNRENVGAGITIQRLSSNPIPLSNNRIWFIPLADVMSLYFLIQAKVDKPAVWVHKPDCGTHFG